MLQEKWIKIILTPRRIYVYILMSYYMILFTHNLTVRNFKIFPTTIYFRQGNSGNQYSKSVCKEPCC